jgi:hypothetical protein
MNLRLLGLCALLGAPFLFITYITFGAGLATQKSVLDGLYSVLYMSGWMCSIVGLWKAGATGSNRWGRIVLIIQLLFLSLANVSNFMLLLQVGLKSPLYIVLDLFWPVSNIWMLATGITVATANRLQGWMRFVPLLVGLWLPLCLVFLGLVFGFTPEVNMVGGVYSLVAWLLLGFVIYRLGNGATFLKPHIA